MLHGDYWSRARTDQNYKESASDGEIHFTASETRLKNFENRSKPFNSVAIFVGVRFE